MDPAHLPDSYSTYLEANRTRAMQPVMPFKFGSRAGRSSEQSTVEVECAFPMWNTSPAVPHPRSDGPYLIPHKVIGSCCTPFSNPHITGHAHAAHYYSNAFVNFLDLDRHENWNPSGSERRQFVIVHSTSTVL